MILYKIIRHFCNSYKGRNSDIVRHIECKWSSLYKLHLEIVKNVKTRFQLHKDEKKLRKISERTPEPNHEMDRLSQERVLKCKNGANFTNVFGYQATRWRKKLSFSFWGIIPASGKNIPRSPILTLSCYDTMKLGVIVIIWRHVNNIELIDIACPTVFFSV